MKPETKYFSEKYIKDGKLVKSKKHFMMCTKCGLKLIGPSLESYKYGICWMCFLKSKKFYKSAKEQINIGWFTWHTKIAEYKTGWSFAQQLLTMLLLGNILNCSSLNKTPKVPELLSGKKTKHGWPAQKSNAAILEAAGVSPWHIKTLLEYYPGGDFAKYFKN